MLVPSWVSTVTLSPQALAPSVSADAARNGERESVPPGDTAANPEGAGRCQPTTGTAEARHEGSEVKGAGMKGGLGCVFPNSAMQSTLALLMHRP